MMTPTTAVRLTGLVWLAMSCILLSKGFALLSLPFLMLGCLIGFFKGFFILKKTAHRISSKIFSLNEPVSLRNLYPLSYWILIGFMSSLGFVFNFIGISNFARGFIDAAIGTALATGSIFYFNYQNPKPSLPEKKNVL
jgi:hypothetical protein